MASSDAKNISSGDIDIPSSPYTVSVKTVVSFSRLVVPYSDWFFSRAPGTREDGPLKPLIALGYSFLVEHSPTGRKIVFDLGLRKNREGHTPAMRKAVGVDYEATVDTDVAEQLREGGVDLESIEAVIWSHTHIDHTGDMSTFPSSVALVVGPGAKSDVLPAYPANPDAMYPESDFVGRKVREITSTEFTLSIGPFKAHDYFGDGSFYLLDTPGHCIGHIAGLARVALDSYVLFAGDAAHHVAQLRPSPFVPLPEARRATLPDALKGVGAPAYDRPFLNPPAGDRTIHADRNIAAQTTRQVQAFDAREDVFVVLSHDSSLDSALPLFPRGLERWKESGIKGNKFWSFLEKEDPANRWQDD